MNNNQPISSNEPWQGPWATRPSAPLPQTDEIMEKLLHYVWQHRIFPLGELRTTEGKAVEIIHPGLHNLEAGPDFFNAQVRIDGEYWVGNVEIHTLSTDWYRHHHETDPAYNNVILHVVERQDCAVTTENGNRLPQIEIAVPQHIRDNYRELLAEEHYPPCYRIIPQVPAEITAEWMAALAIERLESKAMRIDEWLRRTTGDWQRTFFITLARAFGFGTNAEAFEQWAFSVRQDQVGKHRNDPLQVEAYFLGLAGMLDHLPEPRPAARRTKGEGALKEGETEPQETKVRETKEGEMAEQTDNAMQLLLREYRFLKHKFSLQPLPRHLWKSGRLRPQNSPLVRLSQLAALYAEERINFSIVRSMTSIDEVRAMLDVKALGYATKPYRLSDKSIDLLIINAVCPILYAYGRSHHKQDACAFALHLLKSIAPEENHVTRYWQRAGFKAHHAADSQALLHLRARYCEGKDCLRCRYGPLYLQKRNASDQNASDETYTTLLSS